VESGRRRNDLRARQIWSGEGRVLEMETKT
jgi:hypothetical protein